MLGSSALQTMAQFEDMRPFRRFSIAPSKQSFCVDIVDSFRGIPEGHCISQRIIDFLEYVER